MKITKSRLAEIIKEALQEAEVEAPSYKKTREAPKKSPKKDLGPSAHACEAEQTDVVVTGLKEILEKWEESEYESDEARWQEYAKDVQSFIDEYEGDEDKKEKEHDPGFMPGHAHSKSIGSESKPKKKAPQSKQSKSPQQGAPSSPKPKAPKLDKMTY